MTCHPRNNARAGYYYHYKHDPNGPLNNYADTEIGGYPIKAGNMVLLSLPAATAIRLCFRMPTR